ncbi:unnamed protein product [Cylicocyclus nassatus]|uniref:G-protein coupled receptors family 1 profile domain-containing protein n=1 Tax=Cylicocyclus nassatus TaxID=53992 RepID=A0AA36HA20_CYLNA|nr:unnamed protein product [Cylicocyclus nassatus]
MGNLSFLITDLLILSLQITCGICNGFVFFMYCRVKKLRKNLALRMVLYLSISDALLAVTELYANLALLIGLALACCDVTAEFILSPILPRPNCAAIGCFVSDRFRNYWGTSNMVLGLFVIILTVAMLIKLHYIKKNSASEKALVATSNSNTSRFRQANRSSVGILLTSLLFVTLPSVGVGFVEMIGFSIFKTVGPFYILGLLSAGTCNCIVYFALNRDMRVLARNCILGKTHPQAEATTKVSMSPSAMPL